ncbi:hypothetical protein Clacol_005010 [Clathrus columnatus]|uniref:Uncharacterized protein n=1 Tax=Clathrus columnatus TaxID=1419009 RepID=A0AAV5AB29_9AGAM|nr:hypothetical protein Clacol_005010 [Clathrus columnatus]
MLEIFRYECLRISFQNCMSLAQGLIPENLFTNHAPKLKEFHVSRVKLCHNLPIFKTITRLSIKNVNGLTRSLLLDILETASLNLEFLEIASHADFIWPSDTSDPNNRPTILLSSLRTLVLNVGIQVLLLILSRINIPRDVDGRIKVDELIPNASLDLTPFVSFLAKVRKGPYLVFEVYRKDLRIQFKQTHSGPYNTILEMVIDADSDDGQLRRMESILAALELSNVLSCRLDLDTRFSLWMKMYDQMFQPLLFLLDRTERLSIFCDDSDQLDAFVHLLWPRNAQDTITVPCPSLNDLTIWLVRSNIVGSLVQRLAARREAGHVLERLCVQYEDHLGSHTTIQDLEELAENVIMRR